MAEKPLFSRVVVKLSGEALMGPDAFGINAVYEACAFLPLIGLLAAFLPNVEKRDRGGGAGVRKVATA